MEPDTRPAGTDGGRVVPGQEETLAAAQLRPDDDLEVDERAVVEFDLDTVVDELSDDLTP